jgi:hypothetical protein
VSVRKFPRSWVERDLQPGDLGFLGHFAFFKNRRPPSAVVDRLCERGFLAKTARGQPDDAEGSARYSASTNNCAAREQPPFWVVVVKQRARLKISHRLFAGL